MTRVVGLTAVGDLDGVGVSGEAGRRGPGEGVASSTSGDGGDGLQVGAGAVLQVEGDGTGGTGPGDGEGLAGGDGEVAVGKLDSLGDSGEGGDESSGEGLHCDGLGCFL